MPAKKEAPKSIRIQEVRRNRKTIYVGYWHGDDWCDIDCRDNPLPEFDKALTNVSNAICEVMDLNETEAKRIRPIGIILGDSDGTETVQLLGHLGCKIGLKVMPLKTPPVLMEEGGVSAEPLNPEFVDEIRELIEAAKEYVMGNRAQGQLAFEGEEESDDGSGRVEPEPGEELPLGGTASPAENGEDAPDEPETAPRKRRVQLTDAIRLEVKRGYQAGKTNGEIAKETGISLASVHTIRRQLGLVR